MALTPSLLQPLGLSPFSILETPTAHIIHLARVLPLSCAPLQTSPLEGTASLFPVEYPAQCKRSSVDSWDVVILLTCTGRWAAHVRTVAVAPRDPVFPVFPSCRCPGGRCLHQGAVLPGRAAGAPGAAPL